jgi:MFS family permease
MYFGMIVPAYGYAYFAPSIIKGLGYGNISTQLHSVPPWVCAFGLAMILAYASDKVKHRFVFGVVPALIGMAGFAILLAHPKSINLQYASLFLAVSGTYASMPIFIGWFNMNLAGHLRRGTGTAFQIGFGNIGGIIAAYAFPAEDAPRYVTGYALCVAFIIFALAAAVAYFVAVTVQNAARDKMVASGEAGNSQLSAEEEELRGDLNIRYRYLR